MQPPMQPPMQQGMEPMQQGTEQPPMEAMQWAWNAQNL
jgi:hypothetical protein